MPKKKKWTPPNVLKTILIGCEWESERTFLSYLKTLYYSREKGFDITPKNMWWWSPHVTVTRVRDEGHDYKYVWTDTDRPEIEQARTVAKKSWIILFENDPCLEREILRMLQKTKKVTDYKKEFKKHFPEESLCDERTYEKLFPKTKIDNLRRDNNFIFEDIIKLLETGTL